MAMQDMNQPIDPVSVVTGRRKKPIKNPTTEMGFYGNNFQDMVKIDWDALTYPINLKTYQLMSKHLVIASANNLITTMMSRVRWKVEPYQAEEKYKEQADFIDSVLKDMDVDWSTFIAEVSSMNIYGHSIHEIVYRYRRYEEGSNYNDGRLGLKYLPIRSQHSIAEWVYDTKGRDLLGVRQKIPALVDGKFTENTVFIPVDRLLLFRVNPRDGSPLGNSPLAGCYSSWRYLVTYQEIESTTVSKNLNGVPIFRIPAKHMAEQASESDKRVYVNAKKIVSNVNNGENAGLVIPSDFDEVSGKRYFDFEVLNSTASNTSVVSEIVKRYENDILQCLGADVLQLGSTNTGSYSLADSKTSLLETVVEARMLEIQNVINNKLIPSILSMNGMEVSECPTIEFGDISRPDLEIFAKGLQQLTAVGLIYPSAKNVNYIMQQFGFPDLIDPTLSQEEVDKLLQRDKQLETKSGQGYSSATGGLNGTSNSVATKDPSANNLSNK